MIMPLSLNKKKSFIAVFLFSLISVLILSSQFEGFKGKCEIEKIRDDEEKELWMKRTLKLRNEKDISFKKDDTSPLAGKNRLMALKDGKYYLNYKKNNLNFLKKKDNKVLFSVILNKNGWIYDDAAKGVNCFKDNIEIKSGEKLQFRSIIKIEKFTLVVYPLKNYLIATVFDPERKIIKEFKNLKYFPLNYKYYVDAIIEEIKDPKKVIMLTSRNLEKTFYRSAKISFKIDNKEYNLYAYSSGISRREKHLFIPFTDKSTGKESYYTGRYLEIKKPESKSFKLDFNLAFNPLCNYSPAYNCAIPPSENNLELKIEAGEKTYPVKGH